MSTTWKNATMKALIDATLYEMMFKTTGDQIWLDEKTQLSPKIAEIVAALNVRAKKTEVDAAIKESTNDLRDELNAVVDADTNALAASIRNDLKSYLTVAVAEVMLNDLRTELKGHTSTEISKLINGAPNTLDTLGEVATAMAENADVVEALEKAIGSKISTTEAYALINSLRNELSGSITTLTQNLSGHTSNKSNPHGVTKTHVGLGNVDNTSDANKSVKYAASAGSATKATQDASGNDISTTYATKDEVKTASVKYATSAGSATKATQDANGNDISTTYATKDEVKTASEGMRLYIGDEEPTLMASGDLWFDTSKGGN